MLCFFSPKHTCIFSVRRFFYVTTFAFLFCATLVTDVCWESSEPHQNTWRTLRADCKPCVCCAVLCCGETDIKTHVVCERRNPELEDEMMNVWHSPSSEVLPTTCGTLRCFTSSAVAHWLLYIVFKGPSRAKWHVLKTTVLSTSRGPVCFALRSLIINWCTSAT